MLREIRIKHGLRVQQIADAAGLSRPTIDKAERGYIVSDVSASRIASAMSKLSGQVYTIEDLCIQTKGRLNE